MCGAVIFRKFWVFLTRACRAAVAFSSKCRWHCKLGTQRTDLDIRIKLRMKIHANFDVSSRNWKNARKASPARDRYWRVAHMRTRLSTPMRPLIFAANNSERFRTLPGVYTIERYRKRSKNIEKYWKSTKFGTLKKSGSARSKSLIFYRRFPLDVESDSRVSKVGAWAPFQSQIKSYKVPPICGHRCALWWVFLNFCENGSTRRWQNMRKTRQKELKMCICLSCIALELFAAKIGGWEMGPHVRSGNFSKISSIFDACLSSGDHFFIKM